MTPVDRVLVTGADQHQGLAVIRGLGRAGVKVIAAGSALRSLGFASRYASEKRVYASPFIDPARCQADLLRIVRETRPTVIIPSVEVTLVKLNEMRDVLAPHTVLAAPSPEILEYALDKAKTLELAHRCGVPIPRTARGESIRELLTRAAEFTFPLAIKPRGHALHESTANTVGFKARYAATPEALRTLLEPFAGDGKALLVQEYASGVGRCVSAVCDHGRPLALFAYARDREVPLTGGVSVVRRSIPLDDALERYTTTLLWAIRWHGAAMVEYKFDPETRAYTLMEINGRFQASTALSLDAGLNLPYLVAALFAGAPLPEIPPYRVGVEERWLRGDLSALADAWAGRGIHSSPAPHAGPGRLAATWRFLRDFRPGMYYDEFAWDDGRPAVAELRALLGLAIAWISARFAGLRRRIAAPVTMRRAANAPTHRSMRA